MKETFSLLLIPDSGFSQDVTTLKAQVLELTGRNYSSSRAPAHLSVCSFRMDAGSGELLSSFLQELCLLLPALKLRCEGFGSFPSTGTFYLALDRPEIFQACQKEIERALKKTFPPLKRNMSLASKPHITIGRNLEASELEACMQHFQSDFKGRAFDGKILRLMVERMGRMETYREWHFTGQS